MNCVLYFRLNGSNYLVYSSDDNLYLGMLVNNCVVPINSDDALVLKYIVSILCDSSASFDDFIDKTIAILNREDATINEVDKFILLSFSDDKKSVFLDRCNSFYKKKSYSWLVILFLVILIVLGAWFYFFFYSKYSLLNHYVYNYYQQEERVSNTTYELVSVSNIDDVNFDSSVVSFKNPYDYFDVVSSDSNLEVYKSGDLELRIQVDDSVGFDDFFADMYSYFRDDASFYPLIDLRKVFSDNGVNDRYDLMYQCLLNFGSSVSFSSSDDDILNKFVFDMYTPIVVPFSDSSRVNKILLFSGDKRGYAYVTDDKISIELVNDDKIVKIDLDGFSDSAPILSHSGIINFVSSIHFKNY